MRKKIVTLALLFIVLITFVGCSQKDATPQTDDKQNDSTDTSKVDVPSSYSIGFFAYNGKKYETWAKSFYDNIPDKLTVLVWNSTNDNSRQVFTEKKTIANVFFAMSKIKIEDNSFSSTNGPIITYSFSYANGDDYSFQFDGKKRLLMSESKGMYISNTDSLFSISEITIIK